MGGGGDGRGMFSESTCCGSWADSVLLGAEALMVFSFAIVAVSVVRVPTFTALEAVSVPETAMAPPLGVRLRFAGFQRVVGATLVAPVLTGTESALWSLSATVLLGL